MSGRPIQKPIHFDQFIIINQSIIDSVHKIDFQIEQLKIDECEIPNKKTLNMK